MNLFPILLLVFLLVPLAEIYLLLEVGSVIGVPWTIFAVVFTAVLGAYLVRRQGISTFTRVQASLARQELPAMEMMEGLCLLVAGALLLTPGFITDGIGFACLTPIIRRPIIRRLLKSGFVVSGSAAASHRSSSGQHSIDGEYRRIDE
jgi:UPF0716 protein FxsA